MSIITAALTQWSRKSFSAGVKSSTCKPMPLSARKHNQTCPDCNGKIVFNLETQCHDAWDIHIWVILLVRDYLGNKDSMSLNANRRRYRGVTASWSWIIRKNNIIFSTQTDVIKPNWPTFSPIPYQSRTIGNNSPEVVHKHTITTSSDLLSTRTNWMTDMQVNTFLVDGSKDVCIRYAYGALIGGCSSVFNPSPTKADKGCKCYNLTQYF